MNETEKRRISETEKNSDAPIRSYKDPRVYQNAVEAAMAIFELTKTFPHEEKFSLIDQIRKSSRSVCANIGEAWRKRRYEGAFVAKLSDAETEAGESQVWMELAQRCGYVSKEKADAIDMRYDHILSQLVLMIENPGKWLIRK